MGFWYPSVNIFIASILGRYKGGRSELIGLGLELVRSSRETISPESKRNAVKNVLSVEIKALKVGFTEGLI